MSRRSKRSMKPIGCPRETVVLQGIDGVTFDAVEAMGRNRFLEGIRQELISGAYKPQKNRRVDIPKDNGKVRTLQIPCIRDRVVQGALKLILEAIFEADFCPNSYGYRPKRSPHRALAEVRRSVMRRMSNVIDVDLSSYFDTIQHAKLLSLIAKRVQDPEVLRLVKQIIRATGQSRGSARRSLQPIGGEHLPERGGLGI